MTVLNPKFQTAGSARYEAQGWVRETTGNDVYAPFQVTTGGVLAAEPFELALIPSMPQPTAAWFDFSGDTPKSAEDFEDLWAARPATVRTGKKAPFQLQPQQVLYVRVNGGEPQAVTLRPEDFTRIDAAGAEELARVIDRQIVGADARMAVDGLHVELLTVRLGLKAHLEVTGGSANAALAFPTDDVQGTGEAGAFYKTAEFDLVDFMDSGALEVETFGMRVNVTPVIAFRPPTQFGVSLTTTIDDWIMAGPAEHFFGFQPELTVNFD